LKGKLVTGLTLITILGVSLYLSPLRGDTVAVVGVFASLSALIIAVLATTDIEILTAEKENAGMSKTSPGEDHAYKTISNTAKFLDLSHTNIHLRKTNEFKMAMYSSESQVTLSSRYAPRRAHSVKRVRRNDMRRSRIGRTGRRRDKRWKWI